MAPKNWRELEEDSEMQWMTPIFLEDNVEDNQGNDNYICERR